MRNGLFILGQLNDLDVEWLLDHGKKLQIGQGEELISTEHVEKDIYIILNGEFTVQAAGGNHMELSRAAAGEILGEMSFVNAVETSSASVKALQPSEVWAVPRQEISDKLHTDHGFASRFYLALAMLLSDRLRRANAQLSGASSAEQDSLADELDLNVVQQIHLAGSRLEMILNRLSQH